ncbi:threonine/serine exporter family protein [Mycolicibacterium arenosum]|uniref:Threonine/serine exporter family protein n=1 Tax=Mycolicibacterium arenosum TaxID=2952157 RepID=A0ABT1M4N8_9MYCO|nr:threonine/serine exporter family protein [Mycolicibacterium sp. CAU 1645]MCP9274126.1 threonine/serine exporter family protein [Mycolicibacterium sp. CAU 1645]
MTSRRARFLQSIRKEVPQALTSGAHDDDAEVAAMLREVGIALIECEQPTHLVAARLQAIAANYTQQQVRVVVLPTALVVQVGSVAYEVETVIQQTTQLNLASRIDAVAELAEVGAITPADAAREAAEARTTPPRFGPVITVIGYTITTVGFGMVINPTWASLWGYVFLGAVVGAIVMLGRPFPTLNAVLPVLAAAVVTLLASWFVADAANDGLLRVVSPPLVAVLPGLALTIAAMELASAQIISGATRLIYGVTQLMLLVFGVGLGVHLGDADLEPVQPSAQMGSWSLYVAVIVVSVGLYIYLSAPKGSLLWLMLAVGVALIGQKVGGLFMSPVHAGALGAFLVVPFAMLGARIKTSPPAIVMMLAAFWALVPGALSFESLSETAAGQGGVMALGTTVAAIFSIALGTLVGWSVLATINARLRRVAS